LLAEQRRGWRLIIFCARATQGATQAPLEKDVGRQGRVPGKQVRMSGIKERQETV